MVEKKPSLCWDELLRHQPQFICHCDFENCKTGRSDASAGNTFLLFSYMKGAERWNAVRSSEGIRLPCLWFPERRIPTTHSATWRDFIRQPGDSPPESEAGRNLLFFLGFALFCHQESLYLQINSRLLSMRQASSLQSILNAVFAVGVPGRTILIQ